MSVRDSSKKLFGKDVRYGIFQDTVILAYGF